MSMVNHRTPNLNSMDFNRLSGQTNVIRDVPSVYSNTLQVPGIAQQQIHYVTVPVRFTYSNSPNTSRTRPLVTRSSQIQSHHIVHPQAKTPIVDVVRKHRNRIFSQEKYDNFTPRRRIYIESRPYVCPVVDLQRESRASLQNIERFDEEQPQFHEKDKQAYQIYQDSIDNTVNQIKESLANLTEKPLPMVENKSSKSYNQPINRESLSELDIDQMMSVQLRRKQGNRKNSFTEEVSNISPIAATTSQPIPLQDPAISFYDIPEPQPVIRVLKFQQESAYLLHKVLLGLALVLVLFQVVK